MATKDSETTNAEATKQRLKSDYQRVIEELKQGKEKNGRPLNLTLENFQELLYWLFLVGEYKLASIQSKIGLSAFERYQQQSLYFRALTEAARYDALTKAKMNVIASVKGIPEVKDEKGKVTRPPIPPSIEDSKWLIQYEERIGNNKPEDPPAASIGAPRNEEEAKLLEMLLNKHHDYVESRRKNRSENA